MRKIFSIVAAVVFLSAALSGFAYAAQKAVFVIAAENFQDEELARPLNILRKNDIAVTVASTTLQEVTGVNGAKAKPDILLKDVKVSDFDAVVFIGGSGSLQYIDDPVAQKLARDAVRSKKVTGAICLAPLILGKAGVLKGKRATVYHAEAENLKAYGVNYTEKSVEIDGKIVTADGPASAQAFGQALVSVLKGGTR